MLLTALVSLASGLKSNHQLPQDCTKFAFVHIPKTGGTTINNVIKYDPLLASLQSTFPGLHQLSHNPAVEQRKRLTAIIWDNIFHRA